HAGFSPKTPVKELTPEQLKLVLYGNGGEAITVKYTNQYGRSHTYQTNYEGVIPSLERRHKETDSDWARGEIERFMAATPCPTCKGRRLKPETLGITIQAQNIVDVTR